MNRALRVLGVVGRVLLAGGLLILGFVAFQLWGTDLHEGQAQGRLRNEFAQLVGSPTSTRSPTTATASTSTTSGPASSVAPSTLPPTTAAANDGPPPAIGEVVGRIEIPKIHVNKIVVQGVSLEQLDQAPGHYPQTPFPGQAGNAAIAGHRTTYGAPFHNVDRLAAGDRIIVTTRQGRFTYAVDRVFIVKPQDVWVLDPDPDHPNALTLTACHPKYDLTERIIVRASLVGTPVAKLPGQDAVQRKALAGGGTLADGTASGAHGNGWFGTVAWGAACVALVLAAWLVARRRRHGWAAYVVALPLLLTLLFFFYENVSLVLPAGI